MNKTPINNGVLQSDIDAAGHSITDADLSGYAGTNMSWNEDTGQFDSTAIGTGAPGGSNTAFQYNNSGGFGGISSVTYDGTIPITITKDGGANTKVTGVKLVNPTSALTNGENRPAPTIHIIDNSKAAGVVHTYDHIIWAEGGSLNFATDTDGSGVGTTGHAIVTFDSAGNIMPGGGDQAITMAVVSGLDWVQAGGDASHTPKVAMFNNSTPSVPGLGLASNGVIWWDSGAGWSLNEGDTKLTRSAAGVVKLKNAMELTPVAVSALPTGVLGRIAAVNDGTASLAWGATVTGGGSTKYLVWYNGANWTVMGK